MKVVFASGVAEEVREARQHYESEVEGLGAAFVVKLHSAIQDIKAHPNRFRKLRGNFRRHILERFPYGVIYRVEGETIYILAVAHFKREPNYWKDRS